MVLTLLFAKLCVDAFTDIGQPKPLDGDIESYNNNPTPVIKASTKKVKHTHYKYTMLE